MLRDDAALELPLELDCECDFESRCSGGVFDFGLGDGRVLLAFAGVFGLLRGLLRGPPGALRSARSFLCNDTY